MKLAHLSWMTYRIPFRDPFVTAHGTFSSRAGAIVSARITGGYVGYGEIAPLPAQSGTDLSTSLDLLPGLARELHEREVVDILRLLVAHNGDSQFPPPLICGLETALLDAVGQARGQSVAALLASGYPFAEDYSSIVPRDRIPVNATIGSGPLSSALEQTRRALDEGFTCFKIKLTGSLAAMIERVEALRSAVGFAPRLRLDLNGGLNIEQASTLLTQCAIHDIQYVEQPLPAHDLSGMARLRSISPIPLAVDEALTGLSSARSILQTRAADVLVLKPQLVGGLLTCRQIVQEASQRNVTSVLTSTLETGLGVTAALHLAAASLEITQPCGLATLDLLETHVLEKAPLIERGYINVPATAGLGVRLDEETLQHYRQ